METADESLAGEERRAQAAEHADLVLQSLGEGDDVAGVHDVILRDVHLDHRAVGVEPKVADAGAADEEERFAGEEAFETLPFRVGLHAGRGGDEGGALQVDRLVVQVDMLEVAGRTGGDADLAGAVLRREFVDEERLAGEEAAEAALHLGLHHEVGMHRGHRGGLDLEGLAGGDLHGEEGKVGFALDGVIVLAGVWIHSDFLRNGV